MKRRPAFKCPIERAAHYAAYQKQWREEHRERQVVYRAHCRAIEDDKKWMKARGIKKKMPTVRPKITHIFNRHLLTRMPPHRLIKVVNGCIAGEVVIT